MIIIPFKEQIKKKDEPLLSIVTVVYNGERTIERTIQSVINQTYKNFEYIVIDGMSNDNTISIIEKYKNFISYCISEADSGIYEAMNKGVKIASGDYICLLNCDDWFEIDALENIKDEILKKKYDIYHGITRMFSIDNKFLEVYGVSINALNKTSLAHQTCFISKDIYSHYLYDTKYKSAADYDFFCRLVKDNKTFKYIEKIIANNRRGGMSDSCLGEYEAYKIKYKYGYCTFLSYFLHEFYFFIGNKIERLKKKMGR